MSISWGCDNEESGDPRPARMHVKRWLPSALRLAAGLAFVLASIYCLLAFLPYTYFAVIKFPPYAWMPWFAAHFGLIYLVAVGAWAVASREQAPGQSKRLGLGILLAIGIFLIVHPVLRGIDNSGSAYAWALVALVPLLGMAASDRGQLLFRRQSAIIGDASACSFQAGAAIALTVSVIFALFARLDQPGASSAVSTSSMVVLTAWTLVSHVLLAVVVVGLLHGIALVTAKFSPLARQSQMRRGLTALAIGAALSLVLMRALNTMLSFGGWRAALYAIALAVTLTLWGAAVIGPFSAEGVSVDREPASFQDPSPGRGLSQAVFPLAVLAISAGIALYVPRIAGESDWNGMFRSLLTFGFWIVASACVLALWPRRAKYPAVQVAAVVIVSAALYAGLRVTEIYWSRALGATDDEISLALVEYGGHDASFQLVNSLLGDAHRETCGDLCRILREYTNVRNARATTDIELTRSLRPAAQPLPNIFVFVIDSMRPDYLGAYNPKVDYTPNLDALARDGIAFRNAYTQYAGTSLSEPAIWAGATLLHAHYPQPFSRLNSLDRMLRTDGYRRMVSMDEILSELLPADSGVVALDKDKKMWNELEIGSTLQQAEKAIDAQDGQQPIFLYAQPKNVHQFARNSVPSPAQAHWPERPGLNTRIAYEVHCVDDRLGEFIRYLKQRGFYDNSIIVVTSDHGDATGEFGRTSHSTSIWPEIMRVPLIIRLPQEMRARLVYDDSRVSSLIDITPTLYSLLGHRPIEDNPMYGQPLLAESHEELDRYSQRDLLLASDVRAVYGILAQNGRYLYVTYDSPAQSYLFDLAADPNAQHSLLTPALKQSYDQKIIEGLQQTASFYGYRPGVDSLLAASGR